MNRSRTSNRRTALMLSMAAVGMFGFGYLLIPMYDILCEITGFNGRTGDQVEEARLVDAVDLERTVTVEFLATVNSGLRWEFEPSVLRMKVHPGKLYETTYRARNLGSQPSVAQAVPSVSPNVAAPHFSKTECFCFTEQRFDAHEARDMPVRFMVRADLPPDVSTITLSYTFFTSVRDS